MSETKQKKSFIVSPEIFKTYGQDQKLDTMFYLLTALHDNQEIQGNAIQCLRKRKLIDKGVAIASGGVGGAVMVALKFIASFVYNSK